MEKCLVLGGGGFIGSNLVAKLSSLGYEIRVFDLPHAQKKYPFETVGNIEWVEGNFTNPVEVESAMRGCSIIFHLISTTLPKTSNDNFSYDIESNLISSVRLLESAVRHNVRKIIFPSSGGTVYGIPTQVPIPETHPTEPISSYGIGKLSIEKYLGLFNHLYGLDYCILRLANPYGEGQKVSTSQGAATIFLHKALRDETIEIWGDGTVTRDYIYISDVISAMVSSIKYSGNQRIFNIGSGQGLSLNELIQQIELVLGRSLKCNYQAGRPFDVPSNILMIENAREFLDWHPKVSIVQGLRQTLEWLRS